LILRGKIGSRNLDLTVISIQLIIFSKTLSNIFAGQLKDDSRFLKRQKSERTSKGDYTGMITSKFQSTSIITVVGGINI
jgi:hypothetical protein